jgi:1,4-dihydroxy-2-naphthoate octaprenyltransferase
MKNNNLTQNKYSFGLIWSIAVSLISVALSVCCYVAFANEWFLFLGSLSGSAIFAIGKIWLGLKETEETNDF